MITVLKKSGLLCVMLLVAFAQSVVAEDLRIIGEDKSFVATLPSGETITITRQMTDCAKNKGWLQPLVPEPGIVPVTEIEVLNAISDPNTILVDMRTEEWFLDATIPAPLTSPTLKWPCAWTSSAVARVMRAGTAVTRRTWSAFVMARSAHRVLPP